MNVQDLKDAIINNPQHIETILEGMGCHKINDRGDEYRCASPSGDNPTSICVKKGTLSSRFYSEGDTIRGDIITLVMTFKELNFPQAMKFIGNEIGISIKGGYVKEDKSNHPLAIFRGIKKKSNSKQVELKEYDDEILNNYIRLPHIDFVKDRILPITQEKYGICYDMDDSRIIIPHRHFSSGKIVGIFGRTTIPNYEEMMIPKYMGVIPYPKSCNLFGLYENYQSIQQKGVVIVFEAEKSVLQLDSYRLPYGVAIGSHDISREQRRLLIGLDVEVCIAFDNGIDEEYIANTCNKFKHYRRVSYIWDSEGLLGDKDSPSDRGRNVFMKLFKSRRRL